MTPSEKLEKIRTLQKAYLDRIDELKENYRREVKRILGDIERRKVSKIKAELGI